MKPKPKRPKKAPIEAKPHLVDQHRWLQEEATAAGIKEVYFIQNRPDGTPVCLHNCTLEDVQRISDGAKCDVDSLKLIVHLFGRNPLGVKAQEGLADLAGEFLQQWPGKKNVANPLFGSLHGDHSSPFYQRWSLLHDKGRGKDKALSESVEFGDGLQKLRHDFIINKFWLAVMGSWPEAARHLASRDNPSPQPGVHCDKDAYRLMRSFYQHVPGFVDGLLDGSIKWGNAHKAIWEYYDLFWKMVACPYATEGKPNDRWTSHKLAWEKDASKGGNKGGNKGFNHKQHPWSKNAAPMKGTLYQWLLPLLS